LEQASITSFNGYGTRLFERLTEYTTNYNTRGDADRIKSTTRDGKFEAHVNTTATATTLRTLHQRHTRIVKRTKQRAAHREINVKLFSRETWNISPKHGYKKTDRQIGI